MFNEKIQNILQIFVPGEGLLSKKSVLGYDLFKKKNYWPWCGTGQIDTCIPVLVPRYTCD